MLVISRKTNESVMIGHNVEVHINDIRGDKVRLAIDAPRRLSVHRKEVYNAIQDSEPEEPDPLNSSALDVLKHAPKAELLDLLRTCHRQATDEAAGTSQSRLDTLRWFIEEAVRKANDVLESDDTVLEPLTGEIVEH